MNAIGWFAVGAGVGGFVVALTITNLVSWWRQCDVLKISRNLLEEAKAVNEEERLSVLREAEMSDEALAGLLNVPDDHPVLRGVLEVMARAEDEITERYTAPGLSNEIRAGGMIELRSVRETKLAVLSAVEMARGPKKRAAN